MTAPTLSEDSVVRLHPLHLGDGNESEQEVGRTETGVFISLPVQGVDIIKWLDEGLSVGDVKARFTERYGEAPDLDDFLEGLSECGFIQDVDGVTSAEDVGQDQTPPPNRGWRLLGGVSQESVKWLVSTPVRRMSALLWLAVPVAIVLRPDVAPTPSSAWLPYGVTANLLALTGLSWVLMLLHEVAHLLVVRARGCLAYLQLSHRLHFLVAQTDMTAVRSIPRKDRYAPYLAGMTFDMAVLLGALLLRIAGVGGPIAPTVAFIASVHLLFQFAF